ncbi:MULTISPECIES: serine hydrolase [unclassified Phenylobacterium]|uniref:serine hydrolase domain-containing protein n=1 Tax=unclassified Phenylobacterium TaxID=2640670 RepID=UPI00083AD1B1|nr:MULTISPECIES: serine hydrolase domain-containing protein [unclassified Phenylobacterium]
MTVQGFVAPGFEPVREAFAANFGRTGDYAEAGAALSVYREGEVVADLWGGHADAARTEAWTGDTLVNVWSTTKSATAVAVARCVDAGLIAYDQPVAEIWPEFAQAGKGAVTIAQVMSHTAGLSGFAEPTSLDDLYDWDLATARLAAQEPVFEPGTASCYHATTYGFLAGEIVRRAAGRTLGTLLREDVFEPLGVDFHIGLPASEGGRVAELIPADNPVVVPIELLPRPVQLALASPAQDPARVNTQAWRAAELPALNGHASARGVARLMAALAEGGTLDGVRILSVETLAQMTAIVSDREDMLFGANPQWGMGVLHNLIGIYGPNPRAFGHSGWGGSYGCADPDARLAIGYVMNHMGPDLMGDPRGKALADAVFSALG